MMRGLIVMELIYKKADITDIELLTTTRIGRPLYEKFGFVKMSDEMEYPC